MTQLHVEIDPELCAASAMCQRIAPQLFSLPDDADTAVALKPDVSDPDDVRLAREARDACPTAAIVLTETESVAPVST